MNVRDAVKAYLEANCPSITGGFFEPQIANNNTPKPFGVVRIGPTTPNGPGETKKVYVHVHADRDEYGNLDELCQVVRSTLDNVDIPCGEGYQICLEWQGTTGDYHDEDRETVMHMVEFDVINAR